ncbi:MAG: hypothetical protein HFE57_14130 [Firmicutes bacterium]|jgi:hypothetical protein|nr:hypothetical protein [Bacillota bacterium]
MKYRLDFITNSSSSSFIFGKPNENTIIIDDVYNIIKKLASDLIDIIDAIDKIASTTSEFKEYYLNLRGYKNILSRFDVYDRLRNDKNFQQTVMEEFKKHNITLQDDSKKPNTSFTYTSFLFCYTDNYDISWIRQIAEDSHLFCSDAVDFREEKYHSNEEYKEKIEECLDWYLSDSTLDDYREFDWDLGELREFREDVSVYDLAYQYLGEVALLGDDPCMPSFLYDYLKTKVDFACMHMG